MKAWFKAHKGQIILNLITILIIGSMLTIYGVKAASQRQASPGGFNPGVFSYQGYLSDKNGQPLTGEYPMVFRLYDQPTGGTVLWEEYREGPNQVPVIDGQVNLMLGNITPIPESVWENQQLFLGIMIGQDAELLPRAIISAVPFAFRAAISNSTRDISDNTITVDKLSEHPFYFYGVFAVQSEWMADVIFNGNYHRFCDNIQMEYSRAETLQAHFTEHHQDGSSWHGRGNGFYYKDWYYVGSKFSPTDTFMYGDPNTQYAVWKYNGDNGYAINTNDWTFERSAIIWCK